MKVKSFFFTNTNIINSKFHYIFEELNTMEFYNQSQKYFFKELFLKHTLHKKDVLKLLHYIVYCIVI